jgi:signal transduction histidine kinase
MMSRVNTTPATLQGCERELREAKARFEEAAARVMTIFETTTDIVLMVDRDCRISYVNPRGVAQLADGRDLIGISLYKAFPSIVDPDLYDQCQQAISDQRPASFEVFLSRLNAWFMIDAFPSPQGLTIYFRDITEQRRDLEARRLIEEQLHQIQKMDAVGQLANGIAHDFSNLLMVISGNLELIRCDAEANELVRSLAAKAHQATQRGTELAVQLLAFSRPQKLETKAVDVGRLVSEFQALTHRVIGKGCEIRLITDENLWPCYVAPAQLETALLNLTLNGRDAMPGGGLLEIEARNMNPDDEAAACLPHRFYVCLAVRDTGCGISPATLDRVFEPFFTTKEAGRGTGLGLSMVYDFVKKSNGHITVDSTVGVGTTVMLYLPSATPEPRDQGSRCPAESHKVNARDVDARACIPPIPRS